MAQVTDRTVGANPTGFDMRTELNNIIGSLESDNSGSSEPLNTVAYMKWLDTSDATYYYYKERNHDNTAWVTLFRYTVATKVMEAVSNGVVLQDSALVHKTGNETIAGVKTFSSSPIVPNATTATQAIAYGQAVKNNGNETIAGVKTFSSSPIVPTPTTGTQAVNKDYVDSLKTIASGTATFTATTNNINLTGIGVGVELGDVIQISGAADAKNNSEFTVEVITDNNNIIVNQAHANKGTSKNVANRASDTGVTVKLLSKWYNAPIGLGQGWINVTSVRTPLTNYPPLPNRDMIVNTSARPSTTGYGVGIMQGGDYIGSSYLASTQTSTTFSAVIKYDAGVYSWVPNGGIMTLDSAMELR